jgi:sterol desaturase/sphingolipid hydroxylase (fatty acid hydroxylase superfamily)
MNLIVLAIPVFFLLIAIEVVAARILERDVYRLADSVNDLSCGILDQVLEGFAKVVLFAGYLFLFDHYRFATVPGDAAWAWTACFLGVDFLYYWFHRFGHEVNAGWAAHVVHHQSEEYNLTVALRQGSLQQVFSWVFYLPLALVGFPPLMFLTCSAINTLYQFWIHTRLVGRLGPLEWVLNTPSHHRVHHGRNPKYIDRNHGGTLIVWDRLFGTFQEEEEEPVYGITSPLRSFNPVWANLRQWSELGGLAARASGFKDRILVFLKPPGWRPLTLGGFEPAPPVDPRTYRKFDVPQPGRLRAYVAVQFLIALLASAFFLQNREDFPPPARALAAFVIVASVTSLGWLLESRRHAKALEAVRLVVVGVAGALAGLPLAAAAAAYAALSLPALAFATSGGVPAATPSGAGEYAGGKARSF